MGSKRSRGVAGVVGLGLALAVAGPAEAATYEPTTKADGRPGKCKQRNCTLREAVIRANRHDGPDRVLLKGGRAYQLTRRGRNEEASRRGDLDLNDDLTLKSAGPRLATIDGNGIDRVIDTVRGAPARITISRLRIREGRTEGFESGGGIRIGQGGVVAVKRTIVRNNRALSGAGIGTLGFGTLVKISRSTLSRNRAVTVGAFAGTGGGISVTNDTVRINGSTIYDNRADGSGGGLAQTNGGSVRIVNSTVSNNNAFEHGGGVVGLTGSMTISSSTVARNLANADGSGAEGGGGLFNGGADFTVGNSIVADNAVGAGGNGPDCYQGADYTSAGVNLISNPGFACDELDEPPTIVADPRLGIFGMHGGPTPTIPLRAGSPAINAAGAGSPPRDQRGVRRSNPDIGAYERR